MAEVWGTNYQDEQQTVAKLVAALASIVISWAAWRRRVVHYPAGRGRAGGVELLR
jgi:hypothetical protein